MGFNITLKFEAGDLFKEARAEFRRKAPAVVAKTARDIEASAKDRAPVDTGNLKNSIQAKQVAPLTWEVHVGAEYGAYVEYGTRRTAAQPFLTPAVELRRPDFEQALRELLQ